MACFKKRLVSVCLMCVSLLYFSALIAMSSTPDGIGSSSAPVISPEPAIKDREPCGNRNPLRHALFGDLHVHTAYSMDAYLFNTRSTPDDAYRFAKGESINIEPLDADGNPGHPVQLSRRLDFAAITDHAENLGPVALCTQPESSVYQSASCQTYRGDQLSKVTGDVRKSLEEIVKMITARSLAVETDEVCGKDGRRCRDAALDPWMDIQQAAEKHYDRSSDCAFTTFVAYEYSLSPNLSKVHRNVIFRNEVTLDRPIHALEEPEPLVLLRRLRDECIDGKELCDVLAIPHNSNFSDGRMFRTEYPGSMNINHQRRAARLRAEMEPVVEIMQIKGDSECRNGLMGVAGGTDELCEFEKMRKMGRTPPPDCEGDIGSGSLIGGGCVDRSDFVRYALVAGLEEAERIGVNPFRFGLAASTDVHNGTIGDVEEERYGLPGTMEFNSFNTNPGGFFGVWAEENSRDAIFDAIRRREVFGTSGPRIQPRFFGGWDFDPSLCESPNLIEQAYAQGVPMGGVLLDRSLANDKSRGKNKDSGAPTFLVSASRDPATTQQQSGQLERVQIIKGWVGDNGVYEQRVYDVAGSKTTDTSLDLQTCEPSGAGHSALCAVWKDPDFDAAKRAVYYSRVVEMPSCRWSTLSCNRLPKGERPPQCESPTFPKTVQERAWTSPIWYEGWD